MTTKEFITKWRASGASERSNYALFFDQMAAVLGVPGPDPATDTPEADGYVIDRVVTTDAGATNYIDLYKRRCFVAEAKQGSDDPEMTEAEALGLDAPKRRRGTARRGTRGWETAMQKAKGQARRYARALPAADGWPPFLMVVDVGYCFDLYADFSGQGKAYAPFPDQQSFRVLLEDVEDEPVRDRLRLVWTDPLALDPQRRSVAATRALAVKLARLASSLEAAGNAPADTADFLMRCLFSMFAEDVRLLPERSFSDLLRAYRDRPETAPKALGSLWATMKTGGFAGVLGADVRHFNGHLFAEPTSPGLTTAQIDLLIEAGGADWSDVEPAIFGTLLEQALDPDERQRLGAHYTPRAYVERLVFPAVIGPLRQEWEAAQAAAALAETSGDEPAARDEIVAFHRRLCSVRVLDPACGTGNFLYVTLEHLKRLEGEVTDALSQYPGQQTLDMTGGYTVSPVQLLGIELNGRAAAIAEVVLWIGYLQWHFRTFGSADRLDSPLLRDYGNVRHRDALLAEGGGKAAWPEAEFVVGNPPFIGGKDVRDRLGDDYTEALWAAYPNVPPSADLVMYFWDRAAQAVRTGAAERFGFVTTKAIWQTFNRRVVQRHLEANPPLSVAYAVRNHPWMRGAETADVRIAMTVGVAGEQPGRLATVTDEAKADGLGFEVKLSEETGPVRADLTIGADVAGAVALKANEDMSNPGVKLHGAGFLVTPEKAEALGLGSTDGLDQHIRQYLNGRDLVQTSRGLMVIDLFGLDADEVRNRFPAVYQHVYDEVKPDRDNNRRASRRENWWLFGETNPKLRDMLAGLDRYIATTETSKHRTFVFLDKSILPDNALINIASDDAYHLGVLSSRFHIAWALAAGNRLGVGNDPRYNKTRTFEPYPFPAAADDQKQTIRALADRLDAHRQRVRSGHADLTLTRLYNVLEAVRQSGPDGLSDADRDVYDRGLVGVLRSLHDDIDVAVAAAYGWPEDIGDADVLRRLVALNAERAAEEARGLVRYLRPEYQNPGAGDQTGLDVGPAPVVKKAPAKKEPWPKSTRDRIAAVRQSVERLERPATASEVAKTFSRAKVADVADVLEALDALGHVHQAADGRFAI